MYNLLPVIENVRNRTGSFDPVRFDNMCKQVSAGYFRKKKYSLLLVTVFLFGICHIILRSDIKMQHIIAERCIRYSTKVGLSPAATTTLPLLDTKIGIDYAF